MGGITLDELIEIVADIAEEVATGQAGHIRTASQNKAMAALKRLRPDAPVAAAALAVDEMCGVLQDKNNPDDSPRCLAPKDHKEHGKGHQFGPWPSAVQG